MPWWLYWMRFKSISVQPSEHVGAFANFFSSLNLKNACIDWLHHRYLAKKFLIFQHHKKKDFVSITLLFWFFTFRNIRWYSFLGAFESLDPSRLFSRSLDKLYFSAFASKCKVSLGSTILSWENKCFAIKRNFCDWNHILAGCIETLLKFWTWQFHDRKCFVGKHILMRMLR